jgi:hypothetical protein
MDDLLLAAPCYTGPELPEAISRLLARLQPTGMSCAEAARLLAAACGIAEPHESALSALGAAADQSGTHNSYHNPGHTRTVAVGWANLAAVHNRLAAGRPDIPALAAEDIALGLYAAFGHDLCHDGRGNVAVDADASDGGGKPPPPRAAFRLERIAARRTADILQQHGIDAAFIGAVCTAIMTTEPEDGLAALHAAARGDSMLFAGLTFTPLDRPAWFFAAQMLRDADLLASAALTAADHDLQSALLGDEIGADLATPFAAEEMFRRAVTERFQSPAGALFLPQATALRAVNQLRLKDGNWLTLAEAAHRLAG